MIALRPLSPPGPNTAAGGGMGSSSGDPPLPSEDAHGVVHVSGQHFEYKVRCMLEPRATPNKE